MRLNATADMHEPLSKQALPADAALDDERVVQRVTHLVDDEVISLASQIVWQVAIFAEFHYHHQWAC